MNSRVVAIYFATLVLMMALDAVFLGTIAVPQFKSVLGDLILPRPRIAPAVLFYLFYAAGILFFVSLPAQSAVTAVALRGAAFGFIAYGTYEFTNYATLKPWALKLLVLDLVWGSVTTAIAASAGLFLGNALSRLLGGATGGSG